MGAAVFKTYIKISPCARCIDMLMYAQGDVLLLYRKLPPNRPVIIGISHSVYLSDDGNSVHL